MGFKFGFKTRRAIMVLLAGLAGGLLSYAGVLNGDVGKQLDHFLAGAAAFVLATGFSIWGFANQVQYTGVFAKDTGIGDLTAVVGFVLAAVLFALFSQLDKNSKN